MNSSFVQFIAFLQLLMKINWILLLLLLPANKVCEGYVFTRVCLSTRGGLGWYPSMHCRWYPIMPCSRSTGGWYPSMHCRFPGAHPGGKLRGILPGGSLQAHTQGGSWGGIWPWGLQAHTEGGSWGESGQGVWGVSRPTPKGEVEGDLTGESPGPHLSQHALRQTPPPTATAAHGTHPIGMHSCFILMSLSSRLLTFSSIMLTDLKDQIWLWFTLCLNVNK